MRISDWSSDVCSSDLQVMMTALPPHSAFRASGWRALFHLLLTIAAMVAVAARPAMAQSILRDAETEALFQDMMDPLLVAAGLRPGQVQVDRKSTRLNSSHSCANRMPSSA